MQWAVVNQVLLSTRRSQELKDQSEKPHSGRRLMEQEKHQEKKSLSPRVNSGMLTGKKWKHCTQEANKVKKKGE